MKIDRSLVYRIAVAGEKCGAKIDTDSDDRKYYHSVIVYFSRGYKPHNSVIDDYQRAYQKYQSGYHASDHRISQISVGVLFVRLFFALFFKKIGYSDTCRVANIVYRI